MQPPARDTFNKLVENSVATLVALSNKARELYAHSALVQGTTNEARKQLAWRYDDWIDDTIEAFADHFSCSRKQHQPLPDALLQFAADTNVKIDTLDTAAFAAMNYARFYTIAQLEENTLHATGHEEDVGALFAQMDADRSRHVREGFDKAALASFRSTEKARRSSVNGPGGYQR